MQQVPEYSSVTGTQVAGDQEHAIMCGIAGIISAKPLSNVHYEQVSRMSDAMVHRGPDGSGRIHHSHVAMAMRRLSIIDVAHGWQPLYNEHKSLALIANGEIYNSSELRHELGARGHVFRTHSDCEVIVHLYEELGTACVQQLRGMFAFALWDETARRVILARDRMGEKPLYLFEQPGMLVFGSELKTLLHSGLVPFVLDPHAIDSYFHYQYVPEPATPLRGVRKLPAATLLTVGIDPWVVSEQTYWRMEDAPPLEGDPVELIRAQLEEVSELTIRSDVPVGVALSGGLDSSAIAALAVKKYPGTLQAFSIGYEGRPRCDERAEARAFADYLQIPFHEVEIRTDEMVEHFPDLVYWRDDPIADISGYSYYTVMKAAGDHKVPVMLQGQGGDELFWGYAWVREALRQSVRKSGLGTTKSPRFIDYLEVGPPAIWSRRGLADWVASFAGLRSSWRNFQRDRVDPRERLIFYNQALPFQAVAGSVHDLFTRSFKECLHDADVCRLFTIPQAWTQLDVLFTRLICDTYLIENGIAQGDRLSMASSVELRLPLVDYRLVETVVGLRKVQSDSSLPPKAWLKKALQGVLPKWVVDRPKRGFQPPVRTWHRALVARYGRMIEDGFLVQSGIVTQEAARSLAQSSLGFGAKSILASEALVLELWCRQQVSRLPYAVGEAMPSASPWQPVEQC
jgi:asparagine synthase (glutamine-hydrolysing)